LTSLAGTTGN